MIDTADRPRIEFEIADGATTGQLIETGTRLLIDELQRPVRAVIVDTIQTDDPAVFLAVVEAHELDNAGAGRLEVGDVLTRAYTGKAA